jgi:hypothetical protein
MSFPFVKSNPGCPAYSLANTLYEPPWQLYPEFGRVWVLDFFEDDEEQQQQQQQKVNRTPIQCESVYPQSLEKKRGL